MSLLEIRDPTNSRGFLIADEKMQGAVFDLPEDITKELLEKEMPEGNSVSMITNTMGYLVITMDGYLAETGCLEAEEGALEGQDLEAEVALPEDVIVGEVMITEEVEAVVVEEVAGHVVVVVVPEEVLMIG
ncbi:unnamed protein product [Eruca vesicaria subsp. sativa]|uniref:Uncharacterized protein n=1 Tax=Eruca vesicaria subsp. sativa TaxID=29727 RepID=A0ABC8L7A1_ERUVS|nr:unnamed protein product [Eruca vesicaria subsp. sativa]